MKREYYENLYIYKLSIQDPLTVLKKSMKKITSPILLERIIDRLKESEIEAFFSMIAESTYDLGSTAIHSLLYKYPLTPTAYAVLKTLDIKDVQGPVPYVGIYNYVYYKTKKQDFSFDFEYNSNKVDLRKTDESDGGQSSEALFKMEIRKTNPFKKSTYMSPERKFHEIFTSDDLSLNKDFMHLLKKICSINRSSQQLREYVRSFIKDSLLVAIMDKNGRVSADNYRYEDLLLVYPTQLYNVSTLSEVKIGLCIKNSNENKCICCGNYVHSTLYRKKGTPQLTSICASLPKVTSSQSYNTSDDVRKLTQILDDCLISGDFHFMLLHCDFLRTAKVFRILLRMHIQENSQQGKLESKYNAILELPQPSLILKSIFLFDLNDEMQYLVISLMKSSDNDTRKLIQLIPYVMKTEKVFFSCFVVIFQEYSTTRNSYAKMVLKNIIDRHRADFYSIMDMILEYYYKASSESFKQDWDYLSDTFRNLAELFSVEPKKFVNTNIYHIFNIAYKTRDGLTDKFIYENIKYKIIQNIIEGQYIDTVNDPDVLVGLMFNDYFSNLNVLFKPSPVFFIKKNLSQILFKIKAAFSQGTYSKKCCIYKILRFVFKDIKISLYFNYIWPSIEYFLNKDKCDCSFYFVEWLSSEHYSPLMVPYFKVPFTRIEDLPILTNKLYEVLRSFFLLNNTNTSSNNNMKDETWIEYFTKYYTENKSFRKKILQMYNGCNNNTKALLGNLKNTVNYERFSKFPENIPVFLVENFLIKFDYEKQELHSFVIQEFIKNIKEEFSTETESFVEQFRFTKYEFKYRKINAYFTFSDYREFLVYLFNFLFDLIKGFDYFKYLVYLDIEVLEYSTLCLIKILIDQHNGDIDKIRKSADISKFDDSYNFLSFITERVNRQTNQSIVKFLLKINTFTGVKVVPDGEYLRFALLVKDFYAVIYTLEGSCESNLDFLQLSYYMIGDIPQTKGINLLSNEYNPVNLFFEFCLDGNYSAALQCYHQLESSKMPSLVDTRCNSSYNSITNDLLTIYNSSKDVIGGMISLSLDTNRTIDTLLSFLKEILDKNSNDTEDFNSYFYKQNKLSNISNPLMLHAFLDYQLVLNSDNILHTLEILRKRREISEDSSAILKIHRYISSNSNIEVFKREIEKEFIQHLRIKKDYDKCIDCIAKMVLDKEYDVIYEHALVKIDQRLISEAKELLRRVLFLFDRSSPVYYKAMIKLCQISHSKEMYLQSISILEESYGNIEYDNPQSIKLVKKLYFSAAKHFEKTDLMLAIEFYYKSFNDNYEAIPRFFHLISDIPKSGAQKVESIIKSIIKYSLESLIPFYNQISNKINVQSESSKYYLEITRAMLESFPFQTFWNTLILVNPKKNDFSLIENLSIENRIIFKNIVKVSEALTTIAKSNSKNISMKNFPEVLKLCPVKVNIPGYSTEINSVRDEIVVFNSLQSPKKITLVGEDGKDYPFIVKYKDDLRKDSRFMDLDILLNKLFDDGYYIRNYNVIPFTHDSGIIEYVPNLVSLKDICTRYYTNFNDTVHRFNRNKRIGASAMSEIMDIFKPVYHRYLKSIYNDPYTFYISRSKYIKTYAIMNIVGWFMGLGDRHSENTHFDYITGDTVHVDLNCIFEKGRTLEIPEKVPFRLTQNIIDGFGTLGVEGTYKDTLKYALQLLKSNRDVVLANLLSFVFDPLFEWAKKKTEPKRIIDSLNAKLNFEDEHIKVEELIEEATNIENLGAMYIGWMAFL